MQTNLPHQDVVLLGIGHTNAHVLRMWRMQPPPNVRLTCISNYNIATYSGMLPGVLAGQYPPERMEIDLVRLCAANGARFIRGEVTGIDVPQQRVLMAGRPAIPFDVLSIGIGSVPSKAGLRQADDTLIPIKPMQTFLPRLEAKLKGLVEEANGRALRLAVVGAGAGGVEITFGLPARVKAVLGDIDLELLLLNGGDQILSGANDKTAMKVKEELQSRRVKLLPGRRVVEVSDGSITCDDGERIDADLVIWSTGASAPPLLAEIDLPKDDRGFLLTDATLKTTADAPIFAVGDTGTISGVDRAKAGVFAVRQAPVLWRNLHHQLADEALEPYRPQSRFLKILNLGDNRAVGEYGPFTFLGGWVWKLKDAIDSKFMAKYQSYEPMEITIEDEPINPATAMRCAGCGGKVAGTILSRVLDRLEVPASQHVVVGLDAPDDAAVLCPPNGRPLAITADFFSAPFDDPYLFGRIAALNAASDIFAMGGMPLAALALVTIPVGGERQQEELLYQMLSGSLDELRSMGATLIGGHTIEGPQLTLGFTVLADQEDTAPKTKHLLKPDDRLVLTKPLGSGILLAAHMQAKCRADWYDALLPSMLQSNQRPANLVQEFGIAGLTDVTGFGLAGHLLEMLRPAGLKAELNIAKIPRLPGVDELLATGIESTLAPANKAAERWISVDEANRSGPGYQVLFDPQTCGGLLMGVAKEHLNNFQKRLEETTGSPGFVIGRVLDSNDDRHSNQIIVR